MWRGGDYIEHLFLSASMPNEQMMHEPVSHSHGSAALKQERAGIQRDGPRSTLPCYRSDFRVSILGLLVVQGISRGSLKNTTPFRQWWWRMRFRRLLGTRLSTAYARSFESRFVAHLWLLYFSRQAGSNDLEHRPALLGAWVHDTR